MNDNICDDDRILLDRTFNSIPINEIQDVSKSRKVSKVMKYFKNAGTIISDRDILNKCDKICKSTMHLKHLQNIPVVEQRSEEWYTLRQSLITASDYGQALGKGKFGTKRDFYIKKCGYQEEPPLDTSILKHGVRYEPVATRFYEKLLNTVVHEFGLIRHPALDFLGASPDGIDAHGQKCIEIKCPAKRKITGEIADQYFRQIQGQLDVLNLMECDFLECKFDEYLDDIDFDEDWDDDGKLSKEGFQKGVVIEVEGIQNPVYSDVGLSKSEFKMWFKRTVIQFHDKEFDVIYYRLSQYSLQTIKRDDEYIKEMNQQLAETWKNIVKYKQNKTMYDDEIGYKAPPKRRPVKCLFKDVD